eukprot:12755969-Ditylum_brightwellii.AAC.1
MTKAQCAFWQGGSLFIKLKGTTTLHVIIYYMVHRLDLWEHGTFSQLCEDTIVIYGSMAHLLSYVKT